MSKEFSSQRLLIRPMQPGDAEAVFDYRSDAQANQFQGFVPTRLEEVTDFIENRIAKKINQENAWFQWSIFEKERGTLIGDLGIHFLPDQQAEFGCTIAPKHHGKGFATEAMTILFDYLFGELNKHRITASIDPRNTASQRLAEKLGMRQEAHFRKSIWFKNEWVDDVVYGILRDEWGKKLKV